MFSTREEMLLVSIHAPGRGATHAPPWLLGGYGVSIHAPGRGATHPFKLEALILVVSIHAPGRGATFHRHRTIP